MNRSVVVADSWRGGGGHRVAMVMAMDDSCEEEELPARRVEKLARTGASRRLVEPTTMLLEQERDRLDDK